MKLKHHLVTIILIIVIITISIFSIQLYKQNTRVISIINEDQYNNFFSSIGYLNQLEGFLSKNNMPLHSELDGYISLINDIMVNLSRTSYYYNEIYDSNIQQPKFFLEWLSYVKHELMNYKRKGIIDEESLKNIEDVLHNINKISTSKYNFNDQIESQETTDLRENFYKDKIWQEWFNEVEKLSFY